MKKAVVLISIVILCNYGYNSRKYTKLQHFSYITIYEEYANNIKELGEYIRSQSKPVYILDAASALYTIPINKYDKNYDMFLKGNLGSKGEEGIINELRKDDNIIILIRNEKFERNWQNPEKVRSYIINNLRKTGEIQIFDIYEK